MRLPAHNMFLGSTGGTWGWNANWTVFLLPNLEQTPLYNAYNFAQGPDQAPNSTVSYNSVTTLSCPSDSQKTRPNSPWAPNNYFGNYGGPVIDRQWTGTIVPFYTCSTTNATPVNGWGPGTCWWGADSNLGFFGLESVTDGTSNTALFSEKLLGAPASGPPPYAGDINSARRGIFGANMPTTYNSPTANSNGLTGMQACQGIPGSTQANGASWLIGFSWTLGYQWHWVVNTYNHYNTPNKLTCIGNGDISGGSWGGTTAATPPTSNHPGGVNMCFTDGSVRFVKDTVNPQAFWAIGTRNGGETVSSDQY